MHGIVLYTSQRIDHTQLAFAKTTHYTTYNEHSTQELSHSVAMIVNEMRKY